MVIDAVQSVPETFKSHRFFNGFRGSWGGFGTPFWLLWMCFWRPGSHFGTKSKLQGEKKAGFGAHWAPESIFAPKSEGPAPV